MAKDIWFDKFNRKPLFVTDEMALVEDHTDPDQIRYGILKKGWRSSVSFDEKAFESVIKDLYNKDTPGIK